MLSHHFETSGKVAASAADVFAYLDDHSRLSSHMRQSSWRMGGGKMQLDFDERQGRAVGSRIRLSGRIVGLQLAVEEVVTEREPPAHKAWETIGTPSLLVVGHYRLGFDVLPAADQSLVRIFIDYALPVGKFGRVLGWLFGSSYAKWCTRQMLRDVTAHWARPEPCGRLAHSSPVGRVREDPAEAGRVSRHCSRGVSDSRTLSEVAADPTGSHRDP